MNRLELCKKGLQHCWVLIPKSKGMTSHSCPTCGQLVYWSETLLEWVKPDTSSGKKIPSNNKGSEE